MRPLTRLLRRKRADRETAIMGVLNVTPDSFSDGARYLAVDRAKQRIDELLADGADVVDIGAESTRPGAPRVSAGEQIDRMRTALLYAVSKDTVVSVDTTDAEVAAFALQSGAHVINDVSCLRDPRLAESCARHGASLIVMHSRGSQADMAGFSQAPEGMYGDIVADVRGDWAAACQRAEIAGLPREAILFDPGLGFMKNAEHSVELLRRLDEFAPLQVPIVVGPSRKSFLAALSPSTVDRRLGGTLAACLWAARSGAQLVRVHDVFEVRQALRVWDGLRERSSCAKG